MIQKQFTDSHNLERIINIFDFVSLILLKFIIIFETIKVNGAKILFLEEHYLRLMASMRICRMEIPMNFTMEFMEEEILKELNGLFLSTAKK